VIREVLSPRIDKNGALQTAKDGGFSDHQCCTAQPFGANANPMPVKTCSLFTSFTNSSYKERNLQNFGERS